MEKIKEIDEYDIHITREHKATFNGKSGSKGGGNSSTSSNTTIGSFYFEEEFPGDSDDDSDDDSSGSRGGSSKSNEHKNKNTTELEINLINKCADMVKKLKTQSKIMYSTIEALKKSRVKIIQDRSKKVPSEVVFLKVQKKRFTSKYYDGNQSLLTSTDNNESNPTEVLVKKSILMNMFEISKVNTRVFRDNYYKSTWMFCSVDNIINCMIKKKKYQRACISDVSVGKVLFKTIALFNIFFWFVLLKTIKKMSNQKVTLADRKKYESFALTIVEHVFSELITIIDLSSSSSSSQRNKKHRDATSNNNRSFSSASFILEKLTHTVLLDDEINNLGGSFMKILNSSSSGNSSNATKHGKFKKITDEIRRIYFNYKSEVLLSSTCEMDKETHSDNNNAFLSTFILNHIKSEFLLYTACKILYTVGNYNELIFNSMEIFYDIKLSNVPVVHHIICDNKSMSSKHNMEKITEKVNMIDVEELNLNYSIKNGVSLGANRFFKRIRLDETLDEIAKNEFSHLFFVQVVGANIINLKRNEKINSFDDYRHYFYKYTKKKEGKIKEEMVKTYKVFETIKNLIFSEDTKVRNHIVKYVTLEEISNIVEKNADLISVLKLLNISEPVNGGGGGGAGVINSVKKSMLILANTVVFKCIRNSLLMSYVNLESQKISRNKAMWVTDNIIFTDDICTTMNTRQNSNRILQCGVLDFWIVLTSSLPKKYLPCNKNTTSRTNGNECVAEGDDAGSGDDDDSDEKKQHQKETVITGVYSIDLMILIWTISATMRKSTILYNKGVIELLDSITYNDRSSKDEYLRAKRMELDLLQKSIFNNTFKSNRDKKEIKKEEKKRPNYFSELLKLTKS